MGGIVSCGKSAQVEVTPEYAQQAGKELGRGGSGAISSLTETQIDEFRAAFNSFDEDGGGSIDSSELADVMKSLGQEPSPEELEKLIKLADGDGSGDIDFFEFVVLVAHKMKDDKTQAKDKERLERAFRIFDANNNGYIDNNELRLIMCNLGEPIKLHEVDDLIRNFDEDGDGTIDIKEFANALSDTKIARKEMTGSSR